MSPAFEENHSQKHEKSGWSIDGELHVMSDAAPPIAIRAEGPNAGDTFASYFVLKQPECTPVVSTIGFAMEAGTIESEAHQHREAQLLYLVRGEFTCEAAHGLWIVPPGSALWIPGGVAHRIRGHAPMEGYNIFLDPGIVRHMPAECRAASLTPLLREIVLRLAAFPARSEKEGPVRHLVAVLLDELANVSTEVHRLPMPNDLRLRKLVAMLSADPSDNATMTEWGRRMGIADRTLNRLLVRETGLSFGRWRQQLHIVMAIQRLTRGASVQAVANDLGYESASSFITMFRKALGQPPGRYMKERQQH